MLVVFYSVEHIKVLYTKHKGISNVFPVKAHFVIKKKKKNECMINENRNKGER